MHSMLQFFPSRTVAVEIGSFAVHWYGIMYLLAFLLTFFLVRLLQRYRGLALSGDDWSSLLTWGVLGVILGGRLGYVFFYEPVYFLHHPLEIPAVWRGGMSSHGGFIGVTALLCYAIKKRGLSLLVVADILAVPVAIGLSMGRIGNFINQELYGTVTALPWGIAIPGVEGLRHPTQLYAVAKDLLIAVLCYWYLRRNKPVVPGRVLALFIMSYGVLRFLNEYLRVQTYPLTDLGVVVLTRGQLLTVPVFLLGVVLWMWTKRREA